LIRFLCKSAFVLFLLLLAVAFFAPTPENPHKAEEGYSSLDALLAVKNTLHDFGSFCERNPDTCATGRGFVASLGTKARDGAKMLYEFLDRQFTSPAKQETQGEKYDKSEHT